VTSRLVLLLLLAHCGTEIDSVIDFLPNTVKTIMRFFIFITPDLYADKKLSFKGKV